MNTVIFDMDGLLIDSEPLWGEAMTEVLANVGILLNPELTKKTTGLRTREVLEYWYESHPWKGKNTAQIETDVFDLVEEKILEKGKAMLGLEYILSFFRERNFKMGLASSSPKKLIETVLDHLHIRKYFQQVCSAQEEEYGKPHPAVYINCAKGLKSLPAECIAFEDSVNGLIAAKAARMLTVAVPEEYQSGNPRFAVADILLHSLDEFGEKELALLQKL